MERLTTRNIAGVAVYKNPFECERCGETIWRLPDYGNGSPTEKLAAYEDAEEQGLLLRLPCKVRDTVYIIIAKSISKQKVKEIIIDEYGIKFKTNRRMFGLCDVFHTVFLTKAEAEAKLAEMEGVEND